MLRKLLFLSLPLFSNSLFAQSDAITLKFNNLRADAATLPAYVMFGGGGSITATNLADHTPMAICVPYRVADLGAGVSVSHYDHGRIYFSLGAPLTTGSPGNACSPNFANPSLPDFTTRWDKIEIDLGPAAAGLAGGANLSAQDFFGIPLQIDSDGGRDAPAKLSWRVGTAQAFDTLGALANYVVSTPQDATGAIGLGNNGVTISNVAGSIVRVISPASVAPRAGGSTVYGGFGDYITYLQAGGMANTGQPIVTTISGHNGQLWPDGPFQTYNLKAVISSAGDLTIQGTVNNGSNDLPLAILVSKVNLTDHAIFGANPSWSLTEGENTNNIVEKVTADYFAALNFGLAGSDVDNPANTGTTIGNSPSWTWYGNPPDGHGRPRLPVSNAFAYAQPGHPNHYMRYAAALIDMSDAYGFAYNDRLESPLASFTDGAHVTLSILPDTVLSTDSAPVPLIVRSAATRSQATPVAPGSIVSVQADLPVSAKLLAPGENVPLPVTLGGLSAIFNGALKAPIFGVHPAEALIQVPWELAGASSATLFTEGRGTVSRTEEVALAPFAPGIFTSDGFAPGQGLIVDAQNRLVDRSNAVTPESVVVIYATGLGPVVNQPVTGAPAPFSPLAVTPSLPTVVISGKPAVVLYSGLTPGSVGLYQINVRIPAGVDGGNSVPVTVEMNGVRSNTVTVAIRANR